jgi:hypothetical protein
VDCTFLSTLAGRARRSAGFAAGFMTPSATLMMTKPAAISFDKALKSVSTHLLGAQMSDTEICGQVFTVVLYKS